ncbi:MAG: Aspartyl/glutamyl-tRNA(Asn/Gln) amidotransferase subunit B [Promethearchaeota archaeon]|nr:MAG: Aspartyl/glutamyl-tRNA(Asn/Gln) amidotransferase subunit B [Candidatus Lokiarchaeota archaeon]
MSELEIIIGLEVHIQLTNLETKLFCRCGNHYRGKEPNSLVCPICLGYPGSLPVLNRKAVEFATRLALALNCEINEEFFFFRKNYFYPDLPKGFQISQYNKAGGKAFADGGYIEIKIGSQPKKISLNRIHLEEDPARMIHQGSIASSPYSLVDYNRSGVALIEIVSEPDLRSPEEAREYLNQLKSIIQYTGIADLDLEGSCRVDANVSLKGHPRSEVKNITSFKEVERALKWEIQRHKNVLKRGKELVQETRHWDDTRRLTISLRTKEFEKDYRYFPEEDLVPIVLEQSFIQQVKDDLPEMPTERKKRFQKDYDLPEFNAEILVIDKNIADFFEETVNSNDDFTSADFNQICNWLMGDISRWLNENNTNITQTQLTPELLSELVILINQGKITGKIAKTFIDAMMSGESPKKLIKKTGKQRISDEKVIRKIVKEVIENNQDIVKDYIRNPKAIQALIGKCMAKTKGQADPKITRDIMKEELEKSLQ